MQSWGTLSNGKGQVPPDQSRPWNTGMWSNKEIQQLQQNVAQYCNAHDILEPSEIIFGRTKAERSGFYRDISRDINRPLFAVYRKVIRIYDCRNYLGRYGKDELEQLKALHSIHGNNWQAIGAVLGRSPASVKDRCRLLAGSSCNRGAWTSLEEETLTVAVQDQMTLPSWSGSSSNISWAAVAAIVGTRTDKQCRAKWLHYLGWKTNAGTPWIKADDLQLICRLSVCGVSEEHSVDWAALAKDWAAARSPHWLRSKWWALKHKLPTEQRDSLAECCRKLYESIPSSILQNTLIEMPASSPTLAASCGDQLPGNRSEVTAADGNKPSPSVRLCIPAAKFADVINADVPAQVMQQRLIESAVIFTGPSDMQRLNDEKETNNQRREDDCKLHKKLNPPAPSENDNRNLDKTNDHHLQNTQSVGISGFSKSPGNLNDVIMQDKECEVNEGSHASEVYYDGVQDDDIVYDCGVGALGGDVFIIDGEVCVIGSEVCAITNESVDNDANHPFELEEVQTDATGNLVCDNNNAILGGGAREGTAVVPATVRPSDASSQAELCLDLCDLQSRNSSLLTATDDPVLSTTAPPRQHRPL